jgi:hypothetical protein
MSRSKRPDAVEKIERHYDDLQDLAESDLPISDIAETLLEAGADK